MYLIYMQIYWMHVYDMNLLPIYQNLKDLKRKGSMNSQCFGGV